MAVEAAATAREYSILPLFRRMLATTPARPLLTFVNDKGQDEDTLTVKRLTSAAESVAEALREWGIRRGDRVVLAYPPSLDFVVAMLGCLIAGVIPVPVYPPNTLKLRVDLAGFMAVVASSGAVAALTNSAYDRTRTLGSVTGLISRERPKWPKFPWYRTDRLPAAAAGVVVWHQPSSPDTPAFLQYTSGSTATPKGVVITHGNLHAEVLANARDLGLDESTRGVFWVPQYHDLGLISVILSTLAGNGHNRIMSPLTFLQRPAVWFEVMSRVGATHTAAPNFAFEFALRRTTDEQRRRWDLSSTRVVMSAAEPIRPQTVRAFYDAFAVSGLRGDSFYPAYGLAEHTVSVSMGGRAVLRLDKAELERGRAVPVTGGTDRPVVEVPGCGRVTKPDARVRIVDPDTCRPRPDGEVGEIWVRSATKALGYFGLETETEQTFHAVPADDEDTETYLRTGDLGFLHDGELFVTGRHKDLIILHGRNLYPQDIEDSLRECHPLVRPGGIAAFAVDDPSGERVVAFVESRQDKLSRTEADDVVETVRRRLYTDHQLDTPVVVIGRGGLVRKTTSGKVRRGACRQDYLDGRVHDGPRTIVVDAGRAGGQG